MKSSDAPAFAATTTCVWGESANSYLSASIPMAFVVVPSVQDKLPSGVATAAVPAVGAWLGVPNPTAWSRVVRVPPPISVLSSSRVRCPRAVLWLKSPATVPTAPKITCPCSFVVRENWFGAGVVALGASTGALGASTGGATGAGGATCAGAGGAGGGVVWVRSVGKVAGVVLLGTVAVVLGLDLIFLLEAFLFSGGD